MKRCTYLKCIVVLILIQYMKLEANNINSGGMNGLLRASSAEPYEEKRINCGLSYKMDWDKDYIQSVDGKGIYNENNELIKKKTPVLYSTNIFMGFSPLRFLEVGWNLPFYYDKSGLGKDESGLGDMEIAFKLYNPFQKDNSPVSVAYFVKLIIPTGKEGKGFFPRHSYYIDGAFLDRTETGGDNFYTNDHIAPVGMVLFSVFWERINGFPLAVHINIDGRVRVHPKRDLAEIGYIGFEWRKWSSIKPFIEFSMENRKNYFFNYEDWEVESLFKDPFWITPGVKIKKKNGLYGIAAIDIGIISSKEEGRTDYNNNGFEYSVGPLPKIGFQVTLGWDGIIKRKKITENE